MRVEKQVHCQNRQVVGIFWISPVNGSFVKQSRRCGARCDRVGYPFGQLTLPLN